MFKSTIQFCPCSFYDLILKNDFNQFFIVKMPCNCVYRGDFGNFLCERPPPPHNLASCDVLACALLKKPGVYPGPLKAQALSGSR